MKTAMGFGWSLIIMGGVGLVLVADTIRRGDLEDDCGIVIIRKTERPKEFWFWTIVLLLGCLYLLAGGIVMVVFMPND